MSKSAHDKGNRIVRVECEKAIYRTVVCNIYGHKIVRLKEEVS